MRDEGVTGHRMIGQGSGNGIFQTGLEAGRCAWKGCVLRMILVLF